MNSMIIGLLAETSIHPGSGQSAGFVDLPVAREAATDYPVIVGSSVKGALLDMARDSAFGFDAATRERVFGKQDNAGALLVSDMRLLLLPVRSLKSHYKWVTCPHLIERLVRDLRRDSLSDPPTFNFSNLENGTYLGADEGELFLEERQFQFACEPSDRDKLHGLIAKLIRHNESQARLPAQLVVISNKDFAWFARFGLAVSARNQLKEKEKTSNNLWYEETIPPDSVFYCLLAERSADALKTLRTMFEKRPYIQVGGNETVGQGWFAVALPNGEGGKQ